MPLLQGIRERILPKRQSPDDQRIKFSGKLPDKLKALFANLRIEDRNGRLRHARNWYRSALYYQGFQNIVWNAQTESFDLYEPYAGEDWYTENQYRKDVWTIVSVLNRSEPEPTTRPSSNRPNDIAASKAAGDAFEVIWEEIGYKRQRTWKNLYLTLFGNAFAYSDYAVDRRYGTILEPKFKYASIPLPGMAVCSDMGCGMTTAEGTPTCPSCGKPMEQVPSASIQTKVSDGFMERPRGQLFSIMCSPLEVYARSKIRDGVPFLPYLFWSRRVDQEIVQSTFPKLKIVGGGFQDEDLSQFYIDVLSNLTGGSLDALTDSRSSRYYSEVDYSMAWIRPDLFRGDKELENKFPDGVKFDVVQGNPVEDTWRNESIDDHWTHHRYIVNPHSLWGDGCVDALPVSDQINETNALITRHIRYSTVAKTLYDPAVLDVEDVSNNPEESWIRANPTLDNPLEKAVLPLRPGVLSPDVNAWSARMHEAHKELSGALDAMTGESVGANAPYSAYVFMNERAMGRFLPTLDFNTPDTIQWAKQLLKLATVNWTDERQRKFIDRTGKWAFSKLLGADIGQGSYDVIISNQESRPKTRAEKVQGLEAALQNGVDILSSPKNLIYAYDLWGLPLDGSTISEHIQKAWRNLDKIKQGNAQVTPVPLLDDLNAHIATFREFLVSDEADRMHDEQPQIWQNCYLYLTTCVQMQSMQQMAMNHMAAGTTAPGQSPQPGPGSGPPPPQPPQQQPQGSKQEMAQSPVGKQNQIPMPPLPAGARGTPALAVGAR